MTQQIFRIIRDVQEVLLSLTEEDQEIREVMRTTASVQDLGPHLRMVRHYSSKLRALMDEFEAQSLLEQLPEENTDGTNPEV